MGVILKQASIVTGTGVSVGDVWVDGGKIVAVGGTLSPKSPCREVVCEGKYVLPGMIDTHVHFRTPGLTKKGDAATESRAAVAGGVTTVFDMPNTVPQTTTVSLLREKQELFAHTCLANFGLYMGASRDNGDELKRADEDATVPGIKVFMAESTGEMTLATDEVLEPIFRDTRKRIVVHAEDEARRLHRLKCWKTGRLEGAEGLAASDPLLHALVRDPLVAALGTKRAVEFAMRYEHPTHILHISAAAELPYFLEGVRSGWVTGETCPHYLWFTADDLESDGAFRLMNPVLKGFADQEALWRHVVSGDISQVATDHAPHLLEEKALPYPATPCGVPGVQFALPLMLHAAALGRVTLPQVAQMCAENPVKNFGIRGKGFVEEGFDADLVVVDPGKLLRIGNELVLSRCGWTPYAGMELMGGSVAMTLVNGEVVYEDGKVVEGVPMGRLCEFG